MNGRALPTTPEMQAMVAYIKFLSTGVAPGQTLPGLGSGHMAELDRAADPARGRAIYARSCLACHNSDGSGIPRSSADPALGYMFPPLWGGYVFNDGAGMARLSTMANFVHFTCRTAPLPGCAAHGRGGVGRLGLCVVAAAAAKSRAPEGFSAFLSKPVDTPYPPYADDFPGAA